MLKITINNEEVVSNKDFTIEEEMLNTSSVILNNVYPKSWENDKDYVSRFYHPNDYSKCLIKDEDYTPAEPGLNEEGTNFQVTADTTKLSELTSMKGNTTQNGTPTPTAPQPINVVSGRQDVVVCGKNLLPNDIESQTINGLTITKNEDGSLLINGTSNATTRLILGENIPLSAGTYTVSIHKEGTVNNSCYMSTLTQGTTTEVSGSSLNMYNANSKSYTLNSSTIVYMQLYIGGSRTFTNFKIYPMLEKGSQPSTYEAYKGNTYEINLGKNFFDKSTITSVTNGSNSSGLITSNNINVSTATNVIPYFTAMKLEAGTYTYSFDARLKSGTSTINKFNDGISDGTNIVKPTITSSFQRYSFTKTYNATTSVQRLLIQFTNSTNAIIEIQNIQLEKGSSASSYAEYKTPIELCKIGNYQDRIYKNGNKWYLEKKIGKVVLNGGSSESWSLYTSPVGYQYAYSNFTTNGAKTLYSNYFSNVISNTWGSLTNNAIMVHPSNNSIFRIRCDDITTVADWRTWLGTHNTSVYYVLATPTTTEITDTELISQLESIELLEGLNNVSVVSPYLQGIINLHYNYTNEIINSSLLFCGVVKNSGNISLNPRYPHYQTLQILDFKTFLSEGETLDFVIANKTVEGAIDQIINTISPYGFVKGNIQIIGAETIIGAYSTKDKTAYDVFNYLADITQSRWTTRLIDENTVAIDFYDPTLLPEGRAIQYNQTWFRDNLIDDMSYSYGSNDYRNKQVMTSNEVIGNQEQAQLLYANGYQTQYMTDINIATIESISVNGVPKTYATNDQKELGAEADFYYTIGNNIVESAIVYSTNDEIDIRYLPIVEGRQVITNDDEIGRVSSATGRKGIVARYENRNDAITSNELQLIGQSYIKYKGVPEIKLVVQTRSNIWNIGDRVQFNAPITELTTEYMVKSKKTNYIATVDTIFYTFELTSSFNMEQDINYFDNQRAKAKGNIGEGEAISRNIDIDDTTNIIFYGATQGIIVITTDNTLEARLEAPFNR